MYFTSEEVKLVVHPYNDTIVVMGQVANNLVKIILIDNNSSTNVIFKITLEHMKLGGYAQLWSPFFGFTEERDMTKGTIDLPVTFGTPRDIKIIHMVPFVMVDQPSPYKFIIG